MRFLVHHLLEASARLHPDNVAVTDGERSLTYRQLDGESNRLCRVLVDIGTVRGDRVGIYLDKSIESIVAVYGAMKAGAAYVPLDPDAPPPRLNYVASDCRFRCLLTGIEKRSRWAEVTSGSAVHTLVVLNSKASDASGTTDLALLDSSAVRAAPSDPLDLGLIDQDLAYILYTSGSTGDPKGVMITHRASLAFIEWAAEEFAVGPGDRLSSFAPLHFDLSVFDLYAAARGAAAVVLVPPKATIFPRQTVRFVEQQHVSIWYSVPSSLAMVAVRGGLAEGSLPDLRAVLFAGEVFPVKHLKQLMEQLPRVRFANLYGPTETNVCTWYDVTDRPEDLTEPVPIGLPIRNDHVFAVTDAGGLAGPDDEGELCVRGATVMRGYWGDPERTHRTLVPDPFGSLADLVYRTGDHVRVLEGGGFRYLGRRDGQIKSRGYRIELGDVEAVLNDHPAVVEGAVVAVPDELVTNRIVAFVVVRDETPSDQLASHCAARLPRYMVPESITLLRSLPRTSTGKLDRQRLKTAGV